MDTVLNRGFLSAATLRNVFTESLQRPGNHVSMYLRLDRSHRLLPVLLGLVTLAGVAALFAWDMAPGRFPPRSHDFLAAFSLTMIAVAYLVYQVAHRPAPKELLKAVLLAIAFLFWAANQLWPTLPQATLFNDVAVGLFVLDIFLVIVGWPPAPEDTSFAETGAEKPAPEK